MKFHPEWIVWILACVSFALCQDGIDIVGATKSSLLSEVSKQRDFEATSSQRPTLTAREEQIEDELLSNGATTTENFMEKRKFTIRPLKENEEHREIVTIRYNETGPTTIRSVSSTSTSRNKVSFSSSFKKYDEPEDVTNVDGVDFTTSFDGLAKKSTTDNGERKTRQRLDGFKGVTTNRGKTRFQNEQGTSEIPDLLATLRHKKPIRVKPIDQIIKEDVVSTSIVDDLVDTTTVIQDTTEVEQLRPKFKKPPLIATHHPNFGTSTETSRRPTIRSNLNLKQKISSSIIKTKPSESDVTEPENISNNKTLDIISSNVQSNKIRPVKVITSKGTTTAQQPIPPTATAWALASLKAPNNTNKIFRKPSNVTNAQEQIAKIKPFVTWSTRLQKVNDENSNATSISNNTIVTESKESPTEIPVQNVSSTESSTVNRLAPEITPTESLIHIVSTSTVDHVPNGIDSTATVVGGDTDQNKYEVYGSQKPDVENAKTVIETLRPSSSTTPTESQNSNLLLVTSYKSILENNNTSDIQRNVFTSPETPTLENILNKEIVKDDFSTMTTDRPSVVQHSEEVSMTESVGDHTIPVVSTSTEMFSKIPGLSFDYSEYHNVDKVSPPPPSSPTTTTGVQSSSSDVTFSFSHDIDLSNQNHSTTTEQYIESIKTKLDDKINKSTNNENSPEIEDFTHMFSLDHRIPSSTDGTEIAPAVLEKTTSESPLPINEMSNTSQGYGWSNGPDTLFTDFDSNSTESHDDSDDGQKTFESSSQSSIAVNEPTSESDISENDVPIVINSSSTTTTSTPSTTSTTTLKPTTTTTSTTPIPPTTTTTMRPTSTTTTTTQNPTTTTTLKPTTTTTTPRPTTTTTTTTTTTPRPSTTTTTSTTLKPTTTTTTTTTPRPSTTTTTTTTTPRPSTTTTTSTTLKPTTTITTTVEPPTTTTTTPKPITTTTTTYKPNSITSRPKPVDLTSTTLGPNLPAVQSFLKVLVNSTMKNICESEDELKNAIIKLFESGTESVRTENQIRFLNVNERKCMDPNDEKSPVGVEFYLVNDGGDYNSYMNEEFISLLDKHRLDYKLNVIGVEFMKRITESVGNNEKETENPRVTAAIYLSCIAGVCTLLVIILLVVRKRQKRFNYGQRCTPVSLDDYSMDNISVYNSVRRKGALRASKRSYGNPAFDDSSAVSHSLNFGGLISFSEDRPAIDEEFSNVPVITVKPDELPPGAETKNRYANVIPMPETRVMLNPRGAGHNSDYINANFVKGYKGADKFYIACQAPMQSTLPDFWQMIWEQNTRVIMMVTSLTEKGVERCADYLPPSEVVDCHRLFGDYQVTLKKREVKEKFIVSSLQLKNLETNLWRDVTHLWYGGWPVQGVPSDPGAMLSFLMEARSHMKTNSGPHVVHCSPGTGRTGTVIACDIAIREFELSRSVDIPKTVYAVRRCRAGAVQTRDQYALIYKVINLYASKLSGGVLDSI